MLVGAAGAGHHRGDDGERSGGDEGSGDGLHGGWLLTTGVGARTLPRGVGRTIPRPLVNVRLATFLALNLVRSRKSRTLNLVTLISVVGIAVGVWALIVVMGVTNGFQQAFQDRILGLYPHLVVHKRGIDFREYPELVEALEKTTGVVGVSPVTYDDMMIASGIHRTGAIIKGIELSTVTSVVGLDRLIAEDVNLDDLNEEPKAFALEDGALKVEGLIAGSYNTAVVHAGKVTHVLDNPAAPTSGHARLTVVDLRPPSEGKRLVLERVDDGGDKPAKPTDAPGDEDKRKAGLDIEPEPRVLGGMPRLIGAPPPDRVELPVAARGEISSTAIDVRAGTYDLAPLDERVVLDVDSVVTLIVGPRGTAPKWLVQPGQTPMRERTAFFRVVTMSGTPPSAVSVDGVAVDLADVAAGYTSVPARLPGVLLGVSLAERLKANKGDEVSLVTPLRGVDSAMLGPFGMEPSSTRHRVIGTFESGFYEYDVRLALVNIAAAQRFLNRGRAIRWIEVRTEDLLEIEDTKRRVAATLDPYDIDMVVKNGLATGEHLERLTSGNFTNVDLPASDSFISGLRNATRVLSVLKFREYELGYTPRYRLVDWKEMNANLFGALTLQKVVLALFFSIIIVVGAFVVVGSQMMIIHDKAPDIAILKAMGARRGLIRLTFTVQGVMVAGIGCLIGAAIGVGTCLLISGYDYELEASIYLIDRLPATVEWGLIALVTLGALLTTMVVTQYSAGRAAVKTPVEGLRAVE